MNLKAYIFVTVSIKSNWESHSRTNASLNSKHLLYNYQSGFGKNHSTNFCHSFLNGKIQDGFNKCLITGMTLIDLENIFDTIDHDTLLQKLCVIGFFKHSVNWFWSYLVNGTCFFNLGYKFSQTACVTSSLRQGSILGLLLFPIHIKLFNAIFFFALTIHPWLINMIGY